MALLTLAVIPLAMLLLLVMPRLEQWSQTDLAEAPDDDSSGVGVPVAVGPAAASAEVGSLSR